MNKTLSQSYEHFFLQLTSQWRTLIMISTFALKSYLFQAS
jgi:hypothetical protein